MFCSFVSYVPLVWVRSVFVCSCVRVRHRFFNLPAGFPSCTPRLYDIVVKMLLTQTPYIFYGGLAAVFCCHLATHHAIVVSQQKAK